MHDTYTTIPSARFEPLDHMHFKLTYIDHTNENTSEWFLKKHFIETYLLIFVVSGQGWLRIDGNFVELRSGGLYIGFPGQLVEANVHSLDEYGVYHMSFDVLFTQKQDKLVALDRIKQLIRYELNGELTSLSPVVVGELCQMIYQFIMDKDGLKRYYGQIRFQELMYTIFSDGVLADENEQALPVEQVKIYLEQNYTNKISIPELAAVARMSSRHFMRVFKKRYGCSAMDYLTSYRIKQAQILMRNDHNYRLKDVASYVGYQDESYFRRKFKQISGIPPAAFIRNSKQKIAAVHPFSIGILLALQIIPCAAPARHPWTNYYRRKYQTDKVIPLAEVEDTWLEQLESIQPDYIVAVSTDQSESLQSQLQTIAPVCTIPWENNDWKEHLRVVARFLDRSDIADVWLKRYEEQAAQVKRELAVTIREDELLVLKVYGEHLQVLGPGSIASVFYEDMEMNAPSGTEALWNKDSVTLQEVSMLHFARLLLIIGEDETSKQTWTRLRASDEWNNIDAVRNGKVDILMSSVLLDYTAFTHELMLHELLKLWHDRP
ncbi:helix-turn-helix domain-containing protein [Paenibacillus sp. DCT19]|uniref:helix-turn-helix domain-containing protein n=1 Tax=Paenibacillus sp. DCT19 TaxID=2211212 RepID=UPI000FE19E7B|nr:helix-turn-helix domain-containing protein [Paenibacillus sp. DCT19]